MPSVADSSHVEKAADLVGSLNCSLHGGIPIGTMSVSLYDTAWVSMVHRRCQEGQQIWLFPNSFDKILESQLHDGSWPYHATEVDGILTSLACLLSLHVHAAADLPHGQHSDILLQRIDNAQINLRAQLAGWDITKTDQVGFELLIPSLLDQLKNYGSYFEFPGLQALENIRSQKMKHFKKDILYASAQTTLLHSLEAFVGLIDFDLISHNIVHGSMFGSPASTAAYLIHSTKWDVEAEEYLEGVAIHSSGNKDGGFPCAFPTPVFEISWIATLLLDVDSVRAPLISTEVDTLQSYLKETLQQGKGLTGFAPGFLPDADDTAMSIVAIGRCEETESFCEAMVTRFFHGSHFATYSGERNPSLSANCNVVRAILTSSNPARWTVELEHAMSYICNTWYGGNVKDKWNNAVEYTYLTLAKSLRHLLKAWDEGKLPGFQQHQVAEQIPIVALDIITNLLKTQSPDGSWGSQSCEVTAFAVLAMTALYDLPWLDSAQEILTQSIAKAQQFLLANEQKWTEPSYTWIEKVSYASPRLATAYCIAASAPLNVQHEWNGACKTLASTIATGLPKMEYLLKQTELFGSCNPIDMKLGLIQSQFFKSPLKRSLDLIFPFDDTKNYRWLDLVPFTWIGSRNLGTAPCTLNTLWDMMVVSVLIYQVDEFFETTVASLYSSQLSAVEIVIGLACSYSMSEDVKYILGALTGNMSSLFTTLHKFVSFFTKHPDITRRTEATQTQIHQEILIFLQAHCQQIQDNHDLATRRTGPTEENPRTRISARPREPFYRWVQGTSADHTSAPFCFAFFLALSDSDAQPLLKGAQQKYHFQDISRHVAARCRLINDYASYQRDAEENNLNSMDFPELSMAEDEQIRENGSQQNGSQQNGSQQNGSQENGSHENRTSHDTDKSFASSNGRTKLLSFAEYENECLEFSFSRLARIAEPDSMAVLRLFITVTELYNQIYLVKDLTSRVK